MLLRALASALAFIAGGMSPSAFAACTVGNPCTNPPQTLGVLAGDDDTGAYGVSFDGSVVVGVSRKGGGLVNQAFRWSSNGGMQGVGSLGGSSWALSTNVDGTVIVGFSALIPGTGNPAHAFRWTESDGMRDLGTLGGRESFAYGVNVDGSVVVGWSNIADGSLRAFSWTAPTGMRDLGTLGGKNSQALAVSGDSSVVVGVADTTSEANHAFRWTRLGGMQDLGRGAARAVNHDGTVVVGGDFSEAFRWTITSGMQKLGALAGGLSSATGVSADGSVVVGLSRVSLSNNVERIFRWTAATGIRDLNVLLTNAGVDMSGITLGRGGTPAAISGNGQFISGTGSFLGKERAFIVRYYDQETTSTSSEETNSNNDQETSSTSVVNSIIAGLTTPSAVQSSINQLAISRFATIANHHAFVVPLLGGNKPMALGNEVGIFASAGSAAGGGYMRYSWGTGFSLLGGISSANEEYSAAELKRGTTGALALQYIMPTSSWLRPFVEGGGWRAWDAEMAFSRSYMNGAGTATGKASADTKMAYAFGRLGVILVQDRSSQITLSAEYGRQWLSTEGYAERVSALNPFEANVASSNDSADIVKLRFAWSHRFGSKVDGTVWSAAVGGFNQRSDLKATVTGIGSFQPTELDNKAWLELGARLGYKLNDNWNVDAFVNGVAGSGTIDKRGHFGLSVSVRY